MNNNEVERLSKSLTVTVDRACVLGEQLAVSIQDWSTNNPPTATPRIAIGRLSWELEIHVAEPPFEEWSGLYDDAIHNLRKTLDRLVWGVATTKNKNPAKPNQIQFPLVEKKENWLRESSRIGELPGAARRAIEELQPFQRSGVDGQPEQDPLLLLNRLSNKEKHRMALLPIITPSELEHSFAVEFYSEAEAAADGEPQVEINGDIFTDKTIIIRQTTRHPIAKVKGDFKAKAQVVILDERFGPMGVTESLAALAAYVPQVIGHILAAVK